MSRNQQRTRYDAMMVRVYESNGQTRSAWTKIGAGFENNDGSISIALDAIPLDWTRSKIILQIPKTEEEIEALRAQKQQQNQQSQGGRPQRGGGPQRGGFAPPQGRRPQRQQQQEPPDYPAEFDAHDEPQGGGFADDEGGGFAG
jgi:hypothetical protein